MAKVYSFDSQQTINSDEDDKQIDVQTFPTTFFSFSETSTQSLASIESANQPISSPKYKFMGGHYIQESQEQSNVISTFKQQNLVQTHHNLNIQTKKYSSLECQNNKITNRNQQTIIQKKNNLYPQTQRNSQEKKINKSQERQKMSLTPRSKKQYENKYMPNKLNGILKVSCSKTSLNGNSKIQPNFDLFLGSPSNKNVSFLFTMEQIKTMRKNNKSNIFNVPIKKNTKLFLV
ncbi:unnamed protein product [Paramecium pentaurelia]|uniref:Uncharacterized protein n=1 Tax=Paramecium pentaurelia TaxID=43138 RepID=A0A8S1V957_9CILI|nr:unnamed protein product [Paramecium pentaurelia]